MHNKYTRLRITLYEKLTLKHFQTNVQTFTLLDIDVNDWLLLTPLAQLSILFKQIKCYYSTL
jgi:hypothetical protein